MKEHKSKKKIIYIVIITIILVILAAMIVVANAILNSAISHKAMTETEPYQQTQEVVALLEEHPYTEDYVSSNDGLKLYGRIYAAPSDTHNWVITLHGHGRDSGYIADISETFVQKGFNVLAPDSRAHGKSEG
ncbi:MAG: hypothetical protein FWC53_02105, partial [Firmicutes bacterium]|nr:hypothetical protein [Bacillota bacterium]